VIISLNEDLWFEIEVNADNHTLSLFDLFLGVPLHEAFNEIADSIWDEIKGIDVVKENVNWTWIIYSRDGNT
jgi:hypothetical protein